MKKQQKPWWCSAASLQNALRFYGDSRSQKVIADAIGLPHDTEDTMVEDVAPDLKRAILELGYGFEELSTSIAEEAISWLNDMIMMPRNGHPVLLCIDNWSHWVTVLGASGCRYNRAGNPRFVVFDPANYSWLKREHGIRVWDTKNLFKHWRASWRMSKDPELYDDSRPYYALAVVK